MYRHYCGSPNVYSSSCAWLKYLHLATHILQASGTYLSLNRVAHFLVEMLRRLGWSLRYIRTVVLLTTCRYMPIEKHGEKCNKVCEFNGNEQIVLNNSFRQCSKSVSKMVPGVHCTLELHILSCAALYPVSYYLEVFPCVILAFGSCTICVIYSFFYCVWFHSFIFGFLRIP